MKLTPPHTPREYRSFGIALVVEIVLLCVFISYVLFHNDWTSFYTTFMISLIASFMFALTLWGETLIIPLIEGNEPPTWREKRLKRGNSN